MVNYVPPCFAFYCHHDVTSSPSLWDILNERDDRGQGCYRFALFKAHHEVPTDTSDEDTVKLLLDLKPPFGDFIFGYEFYKCKKGFGRMQWQHAGYIAMDEATLDEDQDNEWESEDGETGS